MTSRWRTRALVALTATALLYVGPAATAAPAVPDVPTIDAVAKIYPHLAGGTAEVNRERKIRMPSTTCKNGKVIKGATGRAAMYWPQPSVDGSMDVTGDEPVVSVAALRFPTARIASQFLRAVRTEGEDCPDPDVAAPDGKRIRFGLGDERWGVQIKTGSRKRPEIVNGLFVRAGSLVLAVTAVSLEGRSGPSIPQSIALTRLALRTAR